jgi:hypothetical protein
LGGTGNRVYADAVRVISLSGNNNRFYWRRLYNGRRPRVERSSSGPTTRCSGAASTAAKVPLARKDAPLGEHAHRVRLRNRQDVAAICRLSEAAFRLISREHR